MRDRQIFVRNRSLLISLALVLTVFIAYWPAVGNQFVHFDDDLYVTENPHVRGGLTKDGVVWAFTSLGYASFWHPLTWLSHMLDVTLFGLDPRGHHLANIGLHAGNTVLLFLVLRGLTGALWRSALVAAFFAVHPLHVESVAWVAERKDVLSTVFWLLSTAAYLGYVRQQSPGRYATTLGLFALGLLAKPMLVTLPFAFLLLDYWPLGRMRLRPISSRTGKGRRTTNSPDQGWRHGPGLSLLLEKVPFFALSALSSVLAWVAQFRGGALRYGYTLPFWRRVSNALVVYATYLWKTVWPIHLAAFYPHPQGGQRVWWVLAAFVFLVAVSALVLWRRDRRPYLVTGWCWYLGTLVPVIGLVQVGAHAMADRYTYIPLTGIFILAAWSLPASILADPRKSKAAAGAGALVLVVLMSLTWVQTTYWRNDQTLFEHALAVTRGNWVAHNNLGLFYTSLGRNDEASGHLKEALRLQPDYPQVYYNLGVLLAGSGKPSEARDYYLKAIQLKPDYVEAYNNLGAVLFLQGNLGEALKYFQEAARRRPDEADPHFNVGVVLEKTGRLEEAVLEYRTALRLKPDFESAQTALQEVMKRNPNIR